jgi:hypothetical protein
MLEHQKLEREKCKVTVNPKSQRKAKKAMSKLVGWIKINEHAPKVSPTLTPPSGSQKKSWSIDQIGVWLWLSFILGQFLTCELPCRVPKDINPDTSAQNVPMSGESLKAATCSDDEALKLVEDSIVTAEPIGDMLPIDMSIG